MNRRPIVTVILVLVASLLITTAALAQEADTDSEPDLVVVEVRNNSDSPVFIVLTTGQLSQAQQAGNGQSQAGTADVAMTREELLAQRLGLEIGIQGDPDRLISFGLSAGANQITTFTVPRGVYVHRTTACGETVDGVVDITRQLRLVFAPCGAGVAAPGEPSMEKIALGVEDIEVRGSKWQYQLTPQ